MRPLGRGDDAQLGRVGLADRDEAGIADTRAEERVHGQAKVGLLQALHPHVQRLSGQTGPEVLEEERHAAEGAVGHVASRVLETCSYSGWMIALSSGLSRSARSIAASASSSGLTSPVRTSSAWAVASSMAMSVTAAPSVASLAGDNVLDDRSST
jgi:hypothetical protein